MQMTQKSVTIISLKIYEVTINGELQLDEISMHLSVTVVTAIICEQLFRDSDVTSSGYAIKIGSLIKLNFHQINIV